jgi:hypothetical protein
MEFIFMLFIKNSTVTSRSKIKEQAPKEAHSIINHLYINTTYQTTPSKASFTNLFDKCK